MLTKGYFYNYVQSKILENKDTLDKALASVIDKKCMLCYAGIVVGKNQDVLAVGFILYCDSSLTSVQFSTIKNSLEEILNFPVILYYNPFSEYVEGRHACYER